MGKYKPGETRTYTTEGGPPIINRMPLASTQAANEPLTWANMTPAQRTIENRKLDERLRVSRAKDAVNQKEAAELKRIEDLKGQYAALAKKLQNEPDAEKRYCGVIELSGIKRQLQAVGFDPEAPPPAGGVHLQRAMSPDLTEAARQAKVEKLKTQRTEVIKEAKSQSETERMGSAANVMQIERKLRELGCVDPDAD